MTPASTLDRRPAFQSPFLAFLTRELAPRPGRLAAVVRIAICCTVVVFIAMLYKIPEPAYAAYIVFFLGRGDQAITVMTGVVGALAATLATALTLVLYSLDAGEPALRLPLMAGSAFLGMFLLRTMSLGPVAFLVGFLLVVTQSIIDVMPNLETLIRFVMWLWLVVLLPDVVTVLVNLLAGQNPVQLTRRASLRLLDALALSIRTGDAALAARSRAEALELIELRQHAGMLDRQLRSRGALDTSLIETLQELLAIASVLPADLDAEICRELADACDACRDALKEGTAPSFSARDCISETGLMRLGLTELPTVTAITTTLDRLGAGLAQRAGPPDKASAPAGRGLFVPDAFSNSDHVRFALKTTIAVMAAYIIYSELDWPGIRTALITCFFVALGSLGETMHKLTLRLSGALIGGLIGGLAVVYLLPRMEDIGDLSLLIAAASALFAWVATSSERLAYAGMQMALAFYLGVLQDYGPSTDLTVLRDRIAGILLGNVLMSLVFSTIWPVSARTQAQGALAGAIRKLGALLEGGGVSQSGARLAVAQAFGKARQLASIGFFETVALPGAPAHHNATFDTVDRLAAKVFVVIEQPATARAAQACRIEDEAAAAWLAAYAEGLATDRRPIPWLPAPVAAANDPRPDVPLPDRSAIAARMLLRAEIEGMAGHDA